jgi:hypothetical protein
VRRNNELIKIKKSRNADTRSAVGTVTELDLAESSISHIGDVQAIARYFARELVNKCDDHDYTKLRDIKQFHEDFENTRNNGVNFVELPWYKNHISEERHHLSSDNYPSDVNMFDVLEMIFDNVAAGMGRSGMIREIHIPTEILLIAVQNTAKLLAEQIVVED